MKKQLFFIGNLTFTTERLKNSFIKKYTDVINRYEYTNSDIENELKSLTTKFKSEASFSDAIWSLFNKKTLEIGVSTPVDLQLLSNLCFDMSMFLAESGENPTPALENAHKYKLLNLKQHFTKVRVSCQSLGCKNCIDLNEKIFTIENALKNKILPNKSCTSIHFKNGKYPWCTCYYVAVV